MSRMSRLLRLSGTLGAALLGGEKGGRCFPGARACFLGLGCCVLHVTVSFSYVGLGAAP